MDIVSHDPWLAPERAAELGIRLAELPEVWETADFLSLHVPLNPQTKHIVGEASLSRMKRGAVIVNTERGGLVDAAAVRRHLDSGRLGGVALDVLEQEPPGKDYPLIGCKHALLTHNAYYSEESLPRLQRMAAEEVLRVLKGEPPLSPVNLKWMRGVGSQ